MPAACSGFIFALSTAEAFILSGKYRTILVIGGEFLARLTNQKDPGSTHLFETGLGLYCYDLGKNVDKVGWKQPAWGRMARVVLELKCGKIYI